jgi:uncharacterized damage-inducible protein DinB
MTGTDPVAVAASRTNAIARSLLEEFEREVATTQRFLERLPDEGLGWKPHDKSMTAGELALHIAGVPGTVLRMTMADEANLPDFSAPRPKPASLGEVLEVFKGSADYVSKTLPSVDDARMRDTFKIVQNGRTLSAMPRAEFLRAIMLNHWYQHRGQLGVYLRLLGAAVPSSYGPSADEMPRFAGN